MGVPTSTHETYAQIGRREDLSDVISMITPTDTPFLSGAGKEDADQTNHEWQTMALAAADGSNAVAEGDDAANDAATVTVRLGNICQISDKVAQVSTTAEVVKKAGRKSELALQMAAKSKELKRDIETILVGTNQAKVTGSSGTARKTASVLSWIKTNTSKDTVGAGADPATADGAATRTDGTQRAFTEVLLKTVLAACWESGGDPDTAMVGSFNKQAASAFTGNATRYVDAQAEELKASIQIYDHDFGALKMLPNRFSRGRDCLLLQMDLWKIAYLQNFTMQDLARTGLSFRKQIWAEYALVALNEKGSGGVFDLTTS
jgi:hypothetical protein